MQPYPRAPDLVWPGHLHGTGCLSAGAMDSGFPTVVWRLCLGLGFAVTPPILAEVLGGCAWVRVLACTLPFLAGVLGRAWLCGRSACTLFLARVCGVGVCAWARVLAAPRQSWLGCWGVCLFMCALCLYPATPGWGVWCGCVCLGSSFGCAPPLLAGVLGCVCVCVRALLLPRLSWLGCAAWVCVFGCGFRLRPATPGWGVGGCVCLCAHSACAAPLLAGVLGCVCVFVRALLVPRHSRLGCAVWVCALGLGFQLPPAIPGWGVGVCVCVCVRISLVHHHSWLACWGVCVFVCVLRLYPTTPGYGVRCGCACLGSGLGCPPPLLAGVLGSRVCVRTPLVPRHSWLDVRCGCVCLGSGFGCSPPLLAGVFGCVSVCVRAPLVLRHSWLGCGVWVCVLGLGFRLRPATPGWGVGLCV